MTAHDSTKRQSSPFRPPFHRPRFTPVFHPESTAARKKYKKRLRVLPINRNGSPPNAPLRKRRFVGKVERGSVLFRRHTLPQAEPMAADTTAVIMRMFLDSAFTDVIGCPKRLLNLGMLNTNVRVVMNRARGGTERRMWCRNAVLQFGRLGCRSAHDSFEIAGCAGPVIGEIDFTGEGRVLGSPGCRIGETNELQRVSKSNSLHENESELTATATLQWMQESPQSVPSLARRCPLGETPADQECNSAKVSV